VVSPILLLELTLVGIAFGALYSLAALGIVLIYYPNQVQNMDAFSEGSWVAARLFVEALRKLGNNITRDGLVKALESGTYNIGGMTRPLNYGAAGSSHAAHRRATYTQYTSANRWNIVQGFTCY